MRREACTPGKAPGDAPTTQASGGAPATVPLWLCPRALQAGAEPASGSDPGTRRSRPGQVPAGRRKEPGEEASA